MHPDAFMQNTLMHGGMHLCVLHKSRAATFNSNRRLWAKSTFRQSTLIFRNFRQSTLIWKKSKIGPKVDFGFWKFPTIDFVVPALKSTSGPKIALKIDDFVLVTTGQKLCRKSTLSLKKKQNRTESRLQVFEKTDSRLWVLSPFPYMPLRWTHPKPPRWHTGHTFLQGGIELNCELNWTLTWG